MLLKNPRLILTGLAVLGFIFMGGYIAYLSSRLDTVKLQRDESRAQLSSCAKQHVINQEISYDYQKKLSATSSRVAHLKRVYANRCVPLAPASGLNEAPDNGADERDGIQTEWLIEYAGRCQGLKDQVDSWIDYIERIK